MLVLSRRAVYIPVIVLVAFVLVSLRLHSSSSLIGLSSRPLHGDEDSWEWNTTSFFRTPLHATPAPETEDLCDTFPSYLLPRIQIVLKIGATENLTRIDTHLATVTRCISNLIIVSDRESELHGHRVHDVLADLPPAFRATARDFDEYRILQQSQASVNNSMGWRLDRYKFLPMVERAQKMNPTADWFVFLETDTYFFWDNLFRMLDQFDSASPLYFGSPAPGILTKDRKTTWFAFGGAGFVLSRSAVDKLVHRAVGPFGQYVDPPLALQDEPLVTNECCGDSILGWMLYRKGIELSGMWPMFNPHPFHSIPFNEAYWCQPIISLHKSTLPDMAGLAEWENQRNRTVRPLFFVIFSIMRLTLAQNPLLYADLFKYTRMGHLEPKEDWDNGDWGGFQDPPDSPAHASLAACGKACHAHDLCFSYTYDHAGHCVFVRTMRLGSSKVLTDTRLSAGWDNRKIRSWLATHQCTVPRWVKPSTTRIF